jgi:hypothetical protein
MGKTVKNFCLEQMDGPRSLIVVGTVPKPEYYQCFPTYIGVDI